jgi:hypothetical protein
MFENIRDKISRKTTEDYQTQVKREIIDLGDVGVACALKSERIPTELAMDRLDLIRLKGEEKNMVYVSNLASRQIDRIMEAKQDW